MAEHVQCSMLVNMILWCSWTALTVSGSREQERWILKLMTLCGKFSHMMISVHAFLNILPPSLCSLFFGNLYIYCAWHGHVHITGLNPAVFFELSASHFYSINFLCGRLMKSVWLMLFLSDKDRQTVFISLTVISLVGCFLFFLLRKPDSECSSSAEATEPLLQEEPCDNTATRWALRWHYGLCLCTQRRVQPRGSGADWMEQDEEQQQSKKKTQKRSKITRDCTRRCSGTLVVSTFSSVRAPLHCPLLTENSYNMQTVVCRRRAIAQEWNGCHLGDWVQEKMEMSLRVAFCY